jgi:hypothetical protein
MNRHTLFPIAMAEAEVVQGQTLVFASAQVWRTFVTEVGNGAA